VPPARAAIRSRAFSFLLAAMLLTTPATARTTPTFHAELVHDLIASVVNITARIAAAEPANSVLARTLSHAIDQARSEGRQYGLFMALPRTWPVDVSQFPWPHWIALRIGE
jgi:hypothetical protein